MRRNKMRTEQTAPRDIDEYILIRRIVKFRVREVLERT
jgi:hypothetical protein